MKKVFYIFILFFASIMMLVADDCVAPSIGAAKVKLTYTNPFPYGMASKKAVFSVNDQGKKVYFSKGNLVYHITKTSPLEGYFRFADQQYYWCGVNQNASYIGDIDFFAFGSSGKNIDPNASSTNVGATHSLTGEFAEDDWGIYNAIYQSSSKDKSDAAGIWRTLTEDEWNYVLNSRGKNKYGFGRVVCSNSWCGYPMSYVYGLILLPDSWTLPAGCEFNPGTTCEAEYNDNEYTTAQWKKMEEEGAIFLPCVGRSWSGASFSGSFIRQESTYWTATYGEYQAWDGWNSRYYTAYNSKYLSWDYTGGCKLNAGKERRAVRLVHDIDN